MPSEEITHSAADVFELFSEGFIQSANFGSLRPGRLETHVNTGKNSIVSRGSVLFDRAGAAETDIKITFYTGKYIHLYINSTVGGLGLMSTISYNWGLYNADGTPYEFDGHQFGDMPSPNVYNIWSAASYKETVWSIAPYAISFFFEYIVNQDDTRAVQVGMMITPECYEEGAWYPLDIPIQIIDEHKADYITMPFLFDSPDQISWVTEGIYQFFMDIVTFEIDYDDGDISSPTGGGGGTYESRNDWMDWPSLPTLSATMTGFVALYAPTADQMQSIANWLWSSNFFDNIIKNYADPFSNILGLFISPVPPPTVASEFKVGNVPSGITANKVGSQYMQISCGSVRVNPYYNSFADYDNYRTYKLFLPYYGVVDLSTDDFMGGNVMVRYNIDFLTGSASIAVGTTRSSGIQHILHTYSTNIFAQIPFSGANMMSFYNQSIAAASSIISGGIGGNIATMGQGVMGLLNAHPTYGGSRGMGATAGLMGIQYPYLIECRSIRDMPQNYNKNNGIPLNRVKTVRELSGYTEFENIRINIPKASDEERDEIKKIMMEGIIL